MTNLEKYKMYERIIDQITEAFCHSFFKDGVPTHLYSLHTNFTIHKYGTYIRKSEVTSIEYRLTVELRKPWFNKRPSKENVSDIKKLSERMPDEELNPSKVFIHVRDGRTSWASPYTDLAEGKTSFDKDSMEPLLEAANKNYVDNYLVKEGQFACAYCRKATDDNKKVTSDIISRQYSNYRKSFDYCSDKCASHDQMAHEG